MADDTLKDLNYGHPGATIYDLESKAWLFVRRHTTKPLTQIRLKYSTEQANSAPKPALVSFRDPQAAVNATAVKKHAQQLVHAFPQLAPSPGLLPEIAVLSAALQNTARVYDPLVGDLISFGSVTYKDRYDHPRRIVAFPTGETGNVLKLSFVNSERLSWGLNSRIRVDGPTLNDTECAYWNQDAAPIQQICFSQSEDRSSMLAIRLPSKIVFFRPLYGKQHLAASRSQFYHLPPSTIDPCFLFNLTVEETGGRGHADIAFNPGYQLQFAVVDQNSVWSVWDIDTLSTRGTRNKTCTSQGSITSSDETNNPGEDGWAKILWVGDVSTLVVCNRRHLTVVNLRSGSFEYLPSPTLFRKHCIDWILDIRPHPRYSGRIFVLTSSHLLLIGVTTAAQALDASIGEAGAYMLAAWRHYRGVEDITLSCSVQSISETETCVILHSHINSFTQSIIFDDEAPIPDSISTFDPDLLTIDLTGTEHILQIRIEAMRVSQSHRDASQSDLGTFYLTQNIQFYRIFVMRSDWSVLEAVVRTRPEIEVKDFDRSLVRRARPGKSHHETMNEEIDDFIVPDGLIAMTHPKPVMQSQCPQRAQTRPRQFPSLQRDYSSLYDALNLASFHDTVSMDVVVDRLQHLILVGPDSGATLGTLKESVQENVQISDLEGASGALQRIISLDNQEASVTIRSIASGSMLGLIEEGAISISALYDIMLDHWVASLPSEVPTRFRQQRERLTRQIAVDLLLSSHRVVPRQFQDHVPESQGDKSNGQHTSIPILPSFLKEKTHHQTVLWEFSHSLPTPPHSSIPSSSMPPSSPPAMPERLALTDDPINRLGRWLNIRESSTVPAILPPNVNQVLGHWQLGTDPRHYDWDAVERISYSQDLDESSQQQREKERKRKERQQRRQQRENELSKVQHASQQPVVFPRSSPGPMLPDLNSSSQAQSQTFSQVPIASTNFPGAAGFNSLAPQSQVEPGRFGGRPDKKKKKKNRVSGF